MPRPRETDVVGLVDHAESETSARGETSGVPFEELGGGEQHVHAPVGASGEHLVPAGRRALTGEGDRPHAELAE